MGQARSASHGIRAQLNRMVLIPSVTFLALFVVLGAATLAQAVSLRSAVGDGRAGIQLAGALTRLQEERRLSAEVLADPGRDTRRALAEGAERTDESLDTVRDLRGTLEDGGGPGAQSRSDDFFAAVEAVGELREEDAPEPGQNGAADTYTTAIHRGIQLYAGVARSLDDGPASAEAAATTDLMWAQESFSHADAVISGVGDEDGLTRGDQVRITALAGQARHRVENVHPGEADPNSEAPTVATLSEGGPWRDALDLADTIAHHDAPVSVDPVTDEATRSPEPPPGLGGWRDAADQVNADLSAVTEGRAASVVEAVEAASSWMLTLALGGGITSLFAGTVAYGVAARSAGRLTYRLARLRADTLGTARTDLPRIVRRLEAGDSVDLDTEMKQLDHGDDEVGQVADAFNIAQRTAVSAAVKQADIRSGVSRVFLGIAHRNQSLVQRQLQLLDRVEREEEDPDLLESLFQLDHLATRGRRHAENLIILGGAQPGRRWRYPIPLIDVLRGAISETEEYTRVRLTSVPELSLSGAVVADVIHVLAELVENATAYSPPHTEVTIAAETVPKGLAVEIEDRGLGMTEDALAKANTTLSEAPEFDVMAPGTDARLGLFVVARLADKHDVRVQLRPSPYGGTRAVVLVPKSLIASTVATIPDRPRIGGAARRGTHATDEPQESADLLAAGQTPRRNRAALRPVPDLDPLDAGEAGEAGETSDTAGPSDGSGSSHGDGRPPLPRRNTGTARVGAAPGRPGLPRRRRQASLAPQLTEEAAPEEDTHAGSAHRSPEQARRMMDAFSAGTRRGRTEDAEGTARDDRSDAQVGVSTDDHTGESD